MRYDDAMTRVRIASLEASVEKLSEELCGACREIIALESDVRRLQEKPGTVTPTGLQEIHSLLSGDMPKKIQAIKVLREETGCGLKEAKDWIDSYYSVFFDKLPF